MKVEIFGDGCVRCRTLTKHVKQAASSLDLPIEVIAVSDPRRFAELAVTSLPQLVIDGEVVLTGGVGSVEQIRNLLIDNAKK